MGAPSLKNNLANPIEELKMLSSDGNLEHDAVIPRSSFSCIPQIPISDELSFSIKLMHSLMLDSLILVSGFKNKIYFESVYVAPMLQAFP